MHEEDRRCARRLGELLREAAMFGLGIFLTATGSLPLLDLVAERLAPPIAAGLARFLRETVTP